MSTIVEVEDVSKATDVDGLIKDLGEATALRDSQQKPADTKPQRPEYIEEKYWTGDEKTSLVKQHAALKAANTRLGQMRNEVGSTRQLADELIGIKRQLDLQQNRAEPEPPKPLPKLTAASLLENPDQSLDSYLAAREARLKEEYENRIAGLEAQLTGVTLQSEHSDYKELLNDPEWGEWLQSDPVRAREAAYAAQGDTVIASKLISEFKAQRGTATQIEDVSDETPAQKPTGDNVSAAAAAALETAAAGDTSSGKLYSRTALMMLKQRNPEVYEDPRFQEEILKAYQEKRVR